MDYKLHTTFPEDLRTEWNALLDESVSHVPFLRHEYLQIWWRTRGGGEWPQAELSLVTAHRNGQLVAVAPLFHTPDHLGRACLLLLGSIEISDYLDIIVRPADLQPFVDGLLPFLMQADVPTWQALDFYNLLETSASLDALANAAEHNGLLFERQNLQHSPYIPLPGDWETYLSGIDKKQRHEIRRKMRRAEAAEVPVRWYIAKDRSRLEGEIEDFIRLMEQDTEKESFLSPPMRETLRELIICAFDEDCLNLAFLEVDGNKAAAYLSFDYLNRLWVYNSGFDRDFMTYSPGWVLLGYLLQWANENGRSAFDFMRGDEDYKYRFGAIDRFVVRATLTKHKDD
jgi:CelD/BcsL family acetyltransferase involved in cellulose biosynthesis